MGLVAMPLMVPAAYCDGVAVQVFVPRYTSWSGCRKLYKLQRPGYSILHITLWCLIFIYYHLLVKGVISHYDNQNNQIYQHVIAKSCIVYNLWNIPRFHIPEVKKVGKHWCNQYSSFYFSSLAKSFIRILLNEDKL